MPRKIPDKIKQKAISMVHEGSTYMEVSKTLGISKDTVCRWMQDCDEFEKNTKTVKKKRVRAVLLMAQGWKLEQAAASSGLSENYIKQNWKAWAKKYEIEIPKPLPPEPQDTHGEVLSYRIVDGKRVDVRTYKPYSRPPVHVTEEDVMRQYEPDVMKSDDALFIKGAYRIYTEEEGE